MSYDNGGSRATSRPLTNLARYLTMTISAVIALLFAPFVADFGEGGIVYLVTSGYGAEFIEPSLIAWKIACILFVFLVLSLLSFSLVLALIIKASRKFLF